MELWMNISTLGQILSEARSANDGDIKIVVITIHHFRINHQHDIVITGLDNIIRITGLEDIF